AVPSSRSPRLSIDWDRPSASRLSMRAATGPRRAPEPEGAGRGSPRLSAPRSNSRASTWARCADSKPPTRLRRSPFARPAGSERRSLSLRSWRPSRALKERIAADLQTALRAGDRLAVETCRMLLSAINYEEIEKRRDLSPEEIAAILARAVKT